MNVDTMVGDLNLLICNSTNIQTGNIGEDFDANTANNYIV